MRITLESDYALRIVTSLAQSDAVIDARALSERTQVTLRFTLKILHKLTVGGIVNSIKGAKGGYRLSMSPENINLRQIIELIDGPIIIARCLLFNFAFFSIISAPPYKYRLLRETARPTTATARDTVISKTVITTEASVERSFFSLARLSSVTWE